ncbi:hypothetical protein C8Q73DRAFT_697586 [Cubamyces lactineus]|nr:hypothetical protein C8Q73DRAFT_697586 [Cubamyces lactineus]
MSSEDADMAQLILATESFFDENCCGFAATAVLCFEYLITLDREVALFWRWKPTGASILFFANRYLTLALILFTTTFNAFPYVSLQSCRNSVYAGQIMDVCQYVPWALFSALRVFALSRDWLLVIPVMSLYGVYFGVNLTAFRWLTYYWGEDSGCTIVYTMSVELVKDFTIASRSALIAADAIVMAVTWHTTFKTERLTLRAGHWPSFAHTLFRDGAIYFVVMLVLNVLHLTFTVCQLYTDALFAVSYMTIFTEPLTSILVSRFLLNLQEVHRDLGRGATDTISCSDTIHQGTMHFARVIGSLGSSIATDTWPSSEPETISLTDISDRKSGTDVEASYVPRVDYNESQEVTGGMLGHGCVNEISLP